MRVATCAGLAAASVFLASIASAQGLGDTAARERDKRKTGTGATKPAKVYTETDLGPASSTPVSPAAAPAGTPGASPEAAKGEAKPGETAEDPEKAAAEAAEKAQKDWRDKLDKARAEETQYQSTIDRLQATLNDTSTMYSPGWSAAMAEVDKTKLKLAEARAQIATLEEEGRRAGYR
jgi:hypothetical protein